MKYYRVCWGTGGARSFLGEDYRDKAGVSKSLAKRFEDLKDAWCAASIHQLVLNKESEYYKSTYYLLETEIDHKKTKELIEKYSFLDMDFITNTIAKIEQNAMHGILVLHPVLIANGCCFLDSVSELSQLAFGVGQETDLSYVKVSKLLKEF